MDLHLAKKKALVTASTGGIGLEIARVLAREGAEVIVNGRSHSSVVSAIEDISKDIPNARLHELVADNGTEEGFKKTILELPDVDILINNLGVYEAVEFFDITDESWRNIFETNVISGVRISRHYLRGMLEKNHGRVIFISSESAINPAPEMAHYSATKTTQLSISRGLAELTKGTNVTVNSILPGSTKTDGVVEFIKNVYPRLEYLAAEAKFMEENRPTSLIARLIEPSEVANLVAFISSPLASAINGAALRVDGGLVRSVF